MILRDIAQISKVNDTDQDKVDSIKASIMDGTFAAPDLLWHRESNQAITGSHRIEAAAQLVAEGWESVDEYEMDDMEVDDEVDSYCAANEITIDEIDCSNLEPIFAGTPVAEFAKQNSEW